MTGGVIPSSWFWLFQTVVFGLCCCLGQHHHIVAFAPKRQMMRSNSSRRLRQQQQQQQQSSSEFTTHTSFADIAKLYDGFILDQFGVLHNGKEPLEGALECIRTLVESMNKTCVILSNTSSPSNAALEKLTTQIGFDQTHFIGAITSGEEASKFISQTFGQYHHNNQKDPTKCIWLTWNHSSSSSSSSSTQSQDDSSTVFLKQCGNIQPVFHEEEAEFIIAHGCNVKRSNNNRDIPLGTYMQTGDLSGEIETILTKCKQRNLPMVCANPDFIVQMSDGTVGHMPGKIAKRYEEMGGKCYYFGKPYRHHFMACLEALNLDDRVVAHVGDSLHHDILGANMAGIDSVFVTGGIHWNDLKVSSVNDLPSKEHLNDLFQKEGITPTHVIPMFRL